MDYSGHVIKRFPEFEREYPRLPKRFVDAVERTYSTCFWMTDGAFWDAIGDAEDVFFGKEPEADIF